MTEQELIAYVTAAGDVAAVTASEEGGAPEVAWGDVFFYLGEVKGQPFASIVHRDYDGVDTVLGPEPRDGVFRLNVGVGREAFERLIGRPPGADATQGVDYVTAVDELVPHPVYATQSWVSIVNPAERTDALARELVEEVLSRLRRRRSP